MLTFDPAEHRYTWNGGRVPSVTQIIASALGNPFAAVPPAVLERKRQIGQAAHRACELDDAGQLDEATVHPDVAPYLSAWRKFRKAWPFRVLASERVMYDDVCGYAGQTDVIAERDDGVLIVIDIKTGLPKAQAALQTAAYANLVLRERTKGEDQTLPQRYALHATKDGTYHLVPYVRPGDWRDFLACLAVHRIKERIAE